MCVRVGAHWIMMMKQKCRYREISILVEDKVGLAPKSKTSTVQCIDRIVEEDHVCSIRCHAPSLELPILFSYLSQRQSSHWEHSISIGRYRSTQFIISLGARIKRPRLLFYLSQGRSLDPSIYLSSSSMYRVASTAHYPLRPCPCVVVPLAGCNPIVIR